MFWNKNKIVKSEVKKEVQQKESAEDKAERVYFELTGKHKKDIK